MGCVWAGGLCVCGCWWTVCVGRICDVHISSPARFKHHARRPPEGEKEKTRNVGPSTQDTPTLNRPAGPLHARPLHTRPVHAGPPRPLHNGLPPLFPQDGPLPKQDLPKLAKQRWPKTQWAKTASAHQPADEQRCTPKALLLAQMGEVVRRWRVQTSLPKICTLYNLSQIPRSDHQEFGRQCQRQCCTANLTFLSNSN